MLPLEIESRLPEIQTEIERFGAELVEISFRKSGGRSVLMVLADKAGGITLEDCAKINRALGALTGVLYDLEVNSPGLDRSLRTRHDFLRVLGEPVRLTFKSLDGRIETLVGRVLSVTEEALECQWALAEPPVILPMASLVKAVREINLKRKIT